MNEKKKQAEHLKNIKLFRYKGKKYMVSEIDIKAPTFEGCCKNIHDVICCFINGNLSARDKQLTLHRLIIGKKLRGTRRSL